jgi:5'-nucleotidase
MQRILLTNDDGIQSQGLALLERAFAGQGEVWVVAPHVERSACGRAVTLNRPLRVHELGLRRLAVEGTPADCVLLACRHFMGGPPDLAVSGVNQGYNIGEDLDYSGTVAGAAEAALQGAGLALAVSVRFDADGNCAERAAGFARLLATRLGRGGLPASAFLNVNLPPEPTHRVRRTRQGNPLPPGDVHLGQDPRGKTYYWIGNRPDEPSPPADTDRGALAVGCISVTLVTLERTHTGPCHLADLSLDGYRLEAE